MMKTMKRFGSIFLSILMVFALSAALTAFALDDGAYLVSRTTSYANPETGKTVDGGTDIALGDSMCASIVDDKALVEKVGSKYYVTLGLGLMSNISNVRMQVQTSGGGYKTVTLTKTGSCERDGDTCNHYRFQVDDPSKLISPIFYVDPMGRDVQFFVKLNMGSATKGTGNFAAQMVKSGSSASPKADSATKSSGKTAAKVTRTAAATQAYEVETEHGNYSADTKAAGKKLLRIVLIGAAALVALIALILILRALLRKRD